MKWEAPIASFCATLLQDGVRHLGERRAWGGAVKSHAVVLALLVLVSLMRVATAQERTTEVTVLVLLQGRNPQFSSSVNAYRHGFLASMWDRKNTTGAVKVKLVHKGVTPDNISATIDQAAKDHSDLVAVVGPSSAPELLAALPALQKNNVIAFAPLTDALSVRFWDRHFYFFMGDTRVSVYSLIRYAITELRVLRVGYMYLTNVSYGDEGYVLAQGLLGDMEETLCGVFRLDARKQLTSKDAEFLEQWEQFAETRPQAVIVMGTLTSTTASFVRMMLTDSRTKAAYLMAPPRIQELLLSVWQDAVKAGVPFVSGQVITTGSNPMATDTSFKCIQRFQTVMEDYLTNSGNNVYGDNTYHLKSNDGEMMVAGWMAGEVLMQALAPYTSSYDREWFITSLFAQRRHIVDDFVIGDFGGTIEPKAAAQGAISECNQGGNLCFIKRFEEGFIAVNVPEAQYTIELTTCYNLYTLYNPVHAVAFSLTDVGEHAQYAVREILRGQLRSVDSDNVKHAYRVKVLSSTIEQAHETLKLEKQSLSTDIVVGIVLEEMLDVPHILFVDPLFYMAKLHLFSDNVIVFSPTLEQEIFVMAQYLSTTSDPSAHVVVRSVSAVSIFDLVRRSFETFGVTVRSERTLDLSESAEGKLAVRGLTLFIGVRSLDVGTMVKHLEGNKNARVALQFAPFSVLYSSLRELFYEKEISDRVLFTTSLPHWGNPQSTYTIVSKYHATVPNSTEWSPLALSNFAASKVIQYIIQEVDVAKPSSITEYLYSKVVVTVDDMTYGPYASNGSIMCNSGTVDDASSCAKNYGATWISVWSLTRAFNYTVPPLSEDITPSMVYTKSAKMLTKSQIAGIVIASIVVLILLIVLPLLLCRRGARDNDNAPKEQTDPVTLVFTDIESSTALWAACSEIMPDAVATHHRLIRALIAKYRCYEVKTIGDSFMIASKSAYAAVQLVRDLQQVFMQHDWGTSAIDDAYHTFEEDRAAEDEDYVPPTARLDGEVYRQLWNGLRVRAGLHTGLCDIRLDEVTKGYDYYGGTSNTAARTESVANGGQVLLTRAAYLSLSTAEREQFNVTVLDAVPLRGVPKPVEMYQLDAVPGRSFAALRLDREVDEDYDDCSTSDGASESSCTNTLNGTSGPLATAIMLMFSSFPLKQRIKAAQPLLQRWNVRVPSKPDGVSDDDHFRDLIVKLAIKLGRVLERRNKLLCGGVQGLGGTWDMGRASIRSRDTLGMGGRDQSIDLPDVRRVLGMFGPEQRMGSVSSSAASITVEAHWPFRFLGPRG